jgi:hypothetical protein
MRPVSTGARIRHPGAIDATLPIAHIRTMELRLSSLRLARAALRLALGHLVALSLLVGGLAAGTRAAEGAVAAQLGVICLSGHPASPDWPGPGQDPADHADCLDHCRVTGFGAGPLPASVPRVAMTAPWRELPAPAPSPLRVTGRHPSVTPPSTGPPA